MSQNQKNIRWILQPLARQRIITGNKKYPSGWRLRKRGINAKYVIWFKPPPSAKHLWSNKAEIKLGEGKSLAEAEKNAFTVWASKISTSDKPYTLGALFIRYQLAVIPKKAWQTQKSYLQSMSRLTAVFDLDQPVVDFESHQVFQYRDYIHHHKSAKQANLDIEVISHLFAKAIEWGCKIHHPSKRIVLTSLMSRFCVLSRTLPENCLLVTLGQPTMIKGRSHHPRRQRAENAKLKMKMIVS